MIYFFLLIAFVVQYSYCQNPFETTYQGNRNEIERPCPKAIFGLRCAWEINQILAADFSNGWEFFPQPHAIWNCMNGIAVWTSLCVDSLCQIDYRALHNRMCSNFGRPKPNGKTLLWVFIFIKILISFTFICFILNEFQWVLFHFLVHRTTTTITTMQITMLPHQLLLQPAQTKCKWRTLQKSAQESFYTLEERSKVK